MNDSQNVFLSGDRVFLRAFEPNDEEVIARIENHPDSRSTLFYALPSNLLEQRDKSEKQLKDPNSVVFTICLTESGQSIGQTALFRIDWVGRMAVFYIGIAHKTNWYKGYGSEVLAIMLTYTFATLNLNRLQLHVATENVAAIKLYKKLGFIIEGTLREAMYRNGKYADFNVMGILKREWNNTN